MNRRNILKEITKERERQEVKWGKHFDINIFCKVSILTQEVGEVAKAAHDSVYKNESLTNYREELIQVAAMALQMVEHYDKYGDKIKKIKIMKII